MAVFNRLKAFLVRLFLCLHFLLVVWRVTVSWEEHYWLLACAILPFLLEGAYTIVKRAGLEWRLFSLCFFFYLCATLPGIWLLEIKKTMTYQNQNYTQVEDIVVSGVEIPIRLSPNTWVLVAEEMMLYLMILGRWLLPRGGVGREQLTQLLFGFVGIASDIMELFSLFDEDPGVRHNTLMAYCILGVWSLSIFQFTLTFSTAHRPRRARGLRLSTMDPVRQHKVSVLRVELLATVLSMFMQDGPFLVLRLYTMVTFQVITYSLVFFTAKNVLVLLLLNYKTFLLLSKLCCPKSHDDDDDLDDDETDELEKEDEILGPHVKGKNIKKMTPIQHINGRVMHPASRIPQFVDMRNRRHEDGVKLNPLYAGHDIYERQYIGDPQRNHIGRKVRDPQKDYVVQNIGDPLTDYISRNIGDPQRNRVNRNVGEPQSNHVNRNARDPPNKSINQRAGEPQWDDSSQFIGDLQRAIEGPATPAKKMVKGKKYLGHVKEHDTPNDSAKNGTNKAQKPDISTISHNDLIENDNIDMQDKTNGNEDKEPTSSKEAKKQRVGFRNISDGDGNENPTSVPHQQSPDVHDTSLRDSTALAYISDEQAAASKIPTNGAVNALVLATVEWEEEAEGHAASEAGQGQTPQAGSKDLTDPQHLSSLVDIKL